MKADSEPTPRFGLRSFRAKFVLVVGGAVLFDLLLSGGLALWNVQKLSRDATSEVGEGLTTANQEYIRSYAESTASSVDLLLDRVHGDVKALAGVLQGQINDPARQQQVGATLAHQAPGSVKVVYDAQGDWAQNLPGTPSVVSVWGYLLGADHKPLPGVQQEIDDSTVIDLVAPTLMASGSSKLQMYYIGPKERPIFRTVPYTDQAQTFDRLYPGHNKAEFWEFFFPGIYGSWQQWAGDPASRPVPDDITQTAPYTDAITGKLIVSFFQPLWARNRAGIAGIAGADITLDQLAEVVERVKIAETGFGFLTMSTGNVVAINPSGQAIIGLTSSSDAGTQGVTGLERSLRASAQPAIASLPLDQNNDGVIQHIMLDNQGERVPYIVVLKRLKPINLWSSGPIKSETMSVGIVVPEREIYASLFAAQRSISRATNRILLFQIGAIIVSLMIVFAAVLGISKRITAGLRALASAAQRLQSKDYSVRVSIPTRDEVGAAGIAFNRMAEEISFHTENLEQLVDERTRELGDANQEISALNEKLRDENVRLGAELAVARQIQMMVLPKPFELESIPGLEIAAYMRPADEVGGDYYDVLRNGSRVKIGIGDVTGHGLESGVLMLMVQSVARALQEANEGDPHQFLVRLNSAIYKNIERTNTDKHLSLAFLDFEDGRVTLSGQHEDVLVVRADGDIERIDTLDLGLPVGLENDISQFIDTRDIVFSTGDVIVLHTDGVTEAEDEDRRLFGFDRLCKSVQKRHGSSAEEIKTGIIEDLMAHVGIQKIHDDITLVIIRRT
ncbi:HAMP domain-containing protein [Mesorhizobium sp. M1C.F.Ca.ET.193.01.1.1]|uniref:SpoIIE family protein phosphatase n=1 Tax=unclassified Mesorhizobium TaxID=325217 RepID=UPI000FD45F80|nr:MULTISPECIES: SpoIIE family protein phosphatase [unclassified Mesorhizobium]TGT01404.1 HAMP domain-containing protein [bacterium M00.F.Ca.ET.177.01.1.1]TGQ54268.1 HAMP domain-containing protein [Mesorhizobium sp. M1C.F.Ca.ET.210.01.1.1]TGQ72282.1 HAMP domain-containing protein [Mesorhizobium sp. M1C.F.Ca.ET.212.01.1.1]TGR10095.1 HAMP domain-containing protein [Mesorhizobium sp. M1C.F.Ca.ET.204.01.1.1]TGR30217.1 HAMP domain-containing protein [Mesorhizobium sp. M1C.F.Ca.ET.196.01.1.1]